ncbi:C-terminal processing protease CtpA/Prc, contains a PDZ domain [Sinomicrobium oceani]|uniref:C-terminal processing protease CtpA/Prc, contains a PDZ domain n=1 Tax=Sinomicrobium oceani TaxID=1150368 RepID=A0A1K1R4J7_9FLAO|nr:S41 family peptidase [Sinomicrobium oceani]SFW66534.1 C-terminal processing protease CtpA/Prc, contains a PDZ domain [Sinomicrobium oceani]
MKNILVPVLCCLLLFQKAISQNDNHGSETQKLYITIKIWGFLKYYHPEVASGTYDWDARLFEILPEIERCKTGKEVSRVLVRWIDTLGEVRECSRCRETGKDIFEKNFDLSWINDPAYLTPELSERLRFICYNRFQGTPYYVALRKNGTPIPQHEPEYPDTGDANLKLLVLARYWNFISYFHPYTYLADQSWDKVLKEMIPVFLKVDSKNTYRQAIRKLLAYTDDTHTKVRFKGVEDKYLPVKIKAIDDKAVVSGFFNDSIGKMSPFEKGDILLRIDDLDLQENISITLGYVSGSNPAVKRRNAYYRLLCGEESSAVATVLRRGDTVSVTSERYAYRDFFPKNRNIPDSLKWKDIHPDTGYLSMAHINADEASYIMEKFMDKKAIIIDLRNYPAMIYWVISRYLNNERRDFARVYIPDLKYPGKFRFKKNLKVGSKNKKSFRGEVVLLVDDETLSLSEFTAMAFQTAGNVITIGSRTAGADGDVTTIPLADGTPSYTTGVGICYPDDTITQRTGIRIDIEVKTTIKGLGEGRDEILEAAIAYLNR